MPPKKRKRSGTTPARALVIDPTPLGALFRDCGLELVHADLAATQVVARFRERSRLRLRPKFGAGGRLTDAMLPDPMGSVGRLLGTTGGELPFVELGKNQLNVVELGALFERVGLAPDVALAFAKVAVEVIEPKDLYSPVWKALGRSGEADVDVLAGDWVRLKTG